MSEIEYMVDEEGISLKEITPDEYISTTEDCIWFITDLHLSDRELSTTKGMVSNSARILDEIYTTLLNNENIKVVILSGDIQHRTPNKREVISDWTYKLIQIRDLLEERCSNLGLKVYDKEGNLLDKYSPLFSLKGNHDIDKHIKFTYFDELLKLGVITNPKKIIYGKTQLNLLNYGDVGNLDEEIYEKDLGIDNYVLLAHDYIYDDTAPQWAFELSEKGHAYHYSILEQLGYDKVLIGHIHEQRPIVELPFNTLLWQVGCPARTSYTSNSERDEGYTAIINNNTLGLSALNLNLLHYEDYFKTVVTNARRERKNNLDEFSLNLDNASLVYESYEDSIDNMEGIDEVVKEKAKELIRRVEN